MFGITELSKKMKTLTLAVRVNMENLTDVTNIAKEALTEAKAKHTRMSNIIDRIREIEHYLGLRHHHSKEEPQQYKFRQVGEDVTENKRPQSMYYKNNLKKRE